jgi:hypothetical protein
MTDSVTRSALTGPRADCMYREATTLGAEKLKYPQKSTRQYVMKQSCNKQYKLIKIITLNSY